MEHLNLKNLGLPVGPYSHAVCHNGFLFTSGFTAFGTDAQSKSISVQARAIFQQLEQIARDQKRSLADLVKVTIFVTDLAEIEPLRDFLRKAYPGIPPASSLVQITGLFSPDLKIEIEAVFAL
ncbi:RidA family protein [Aestuariispira insulae]|uniref:Enamine deaminase RidA (YjgF/YER057c/UK114 family) n=1 Tax=Aestuariispira insulae TaxID=1461337 RepID=A0A3D9H9J2_9PROT|nr:RidA family protein [Aestuariispira insulae]RED46164.1 enamine deaminase RidA (YjgF/YER057c/UK114 family) [Aestuariispira insulae]